MISQKNALSRSVQVGGNVEKSLQKLHDYEKIVDGCIKNPAKFRILLLNSTCPKIKGYAREKIESEIKDPELKEEFLKMII